MADANPSPRLKRARLFGPDPLPGFVFSLDTSRKDLIFQQPAETAPTVSAVAAAFRGHEAEVEQASRGVVSGGV